MPRRPAPHNTLKTNVAALVYSVACLITTALSSALSAPAHAQPVLPAPASSNLHCPDMAPFVAQSSAPGYSSAQWQQLANQLMPLMPRCLQSSDYYALLGAAQLNSGRLAAALESLERALLLQPDNGAAQIDYAQALYLQGQLFSAIALNQQIINRNDLPDDLRPALTTRQQQWRRQTRQTVFEGDLLVGYDNNLNGAPSPAEITLTLSGESVILPLNPEFKPQSGPYLNARLGARHRRLAPQHQHNALLEVRGRLSEDAASDLLQLDARYAYIRPGPGRSWQANTGLSHLMFGGSPLYTASQIGGRLVFEQRVAQCRPYSSAATQHQLFHNQSTLNAIESRLAAGLSCVSNTRWGRVQWLPELAVLTNHAIKNGRAGGHRQGWQANIDWQLSLNGATLLAQLNHTETRDQRGYNPVLSNNARRLIQRSYALIQYQRPLSAQAQLLFNIYHQEQRSNLELFRSHDTTVEVGFSYRF